MVYLYTMPLISQKELNEMAGILGGMPIIATLPNSPSARLGLGYGDIVLSVNGRKTPNVVEFLEARQLRSDGMSVVIFRSGKELSLEIAFEKPTAT